MLNALTQRSENSIQLTRQLKKSNKHGMPLIITIAIRSRFQNDKRQDNNIFLVSVWTRIARRVRNAKRGKEGANRMAGKGRDVEGGVIETLSLFMTM